MGADDLRGQVQGGKASAFQEGLREGGFSTGQGGDTFQGNPGGGGGGSAASALLMGSHGLGEGFRAVRGMKQSLLNCLAALSAEDTEAMTATPSVASGSAWQVGSAQSAAVGRRSLQCTEAELTAGGADTTGGDTCEVSGGSPGSASARCSRQRLTHYCTLAWSL